MQLADTLNQNAISIRGELCKQKRISLCSSSGKRRFTDCFVGWPGSVHDAQIFQNSKLGIIMRESLMDIFPQETHILGNFAYPLLPRLLTPYRDNRNLSQEQINFNYCHSATRNVVERAFGCITWNQNFVDWKKSN